MAPDLLIIGDRGDRQRLARRIEALGYRALGAAPGEIEQALDQTPTAILLWAHEGEIRPLLARLRSHATGEGIPVVLCGALGGEIRDLADVLELGADRFLVAPIDEDELRRTLVDLLGPADPRTSAGPGQTDGHEAEGATDPFGPRGRDPLLDQLRRTLADLDERPEDPASADDSGHEEDIDLTVMGLALPPINDDHDHERDGLADLSLLAVDRRGPAAGGAGAGARPNATLRLATETGAATPAGDPEVSTAIVARRRPSGAAAVRGDLRSRPVIELLGELDRSRFSGRLHLDGSSAGDLWIVDGVAVHAVGSDPEDRLSVGLRRRGLIDAAEAEALHRRLPTDSLADGALLPTRAPIKAYELGDALADHLEAMVLRWSLWSAGRWSLIADEAPPSVPFCSCPLGQLIVAATSLDGDDAVARRRLGPADRRPLRRRAATLDDLAAPPSIEGWFAGLDGRRTIDEVVADEPSERVAWLRALVAMGRVVLLEVDADAAAAIDRRRIDARLVHARRGDHPALLGVDASASAAEIAGAHRGLARTFAAARLEPATVARWSAELEELRVALDRAREVLTAGPRPLTTRTDREEP